MSSNSNVNLANQSIIFSGLLAFRCEQFLYTGEGLHQLKHYNTIGEKWYDKDRHVSTSTDTINAFQMHFCPRHDKEGGKNFSLKRFFNSTSIIQASSGPSTPVGKSKIPMINQSIVNKSNVSKYRIHSIIKHKFGF